MGQMGRYLQEYLTLLVWPICFLASSAPKGMGYPTLQGELSILFHGCQSTVNVCTLPLCRIILLGRLDLGSTPGVIRKDSYSNS